MIGVKEMRPSGEEEGLRVDLPHSGIGAQLG